MTNETGLRAHALDELRRRLAGYRKYELRDGRNSTTVRAAVERTYELMTKEDIRRAAEAADDGLLLPIVWPEGFVLVTPAQAKELAASVAEFRDRTYNFLSQILNRIAAGEITTPAQIDGAAWPA